MSEVSKPFRSGFVALVGPANAGKSTLLNALLKRKVSIVSPKEQTTRGRVIGVKNLESAQIVFVDTPGILSRQYRGALSRFLNSELSESARDSDCCVLVVDSVVALENPRYVERVKISLRQRGIGEPAIVALNKIDQLDQRSLLPILARLKEEFGEETTEFVPISAKKGQGLEFICKLLLDRLPEGPAFFPLDMPSDQPDQVLAAEIVREKLMLRLSQEVPYSAAVLVTQWNETEKIIKIDAEIAVERPSQKAIVIGKGGQMLKSVGIAARQDLEKIFNVQVHLQLHVKVQPGWTKSDMKVAQWHSRLQ
jgi:GTP-binding protein Era